MLVLFRAVLYGSIFVGFWLLYLPWRLLAWSGIPRPAAGGWMHVLALVIGIAGTVLMLACVAVFVRVGKGTPAPFDPPRRLVVSGPYSIVRNPMYVGAFMLLAGVALFYRSGWIALYGLLVLICANFFVVLYEEPTLRRVFGTDYED